MLDGANLEPRFSGDRLIAAVYRKAAKRLRPGMLVFQAIGATKANCVEQEIAIRDFFKIFPLSRFNESNPLTVAGHELRVTALLLAAEFVENGTTV